MTEGVIERKKPFLSGTTRRVQFTIVDQATGLGFQPSTLTLSVYDVNTTVNQRWSTTFTVAPPLLPGDPLAVPTPLTVSVVNAQNDADISAFVDSDGHVDLDLSVQDTEIPIPPAMYATPYQRHVSFTWTWASPAKTGKLMLILSVMPDWETAAA